MRSTWSKQNWDSSERRQSQESENLGSNQISLPQPPFSQTVILRFT